MAAPRTEPLAFGELRIAKQRVAIATGGHRRSRAGRAIPTSRIEVFALLFRLAGLMPSWPGRKRCVTVMDSMM